ncbi:phospholipase B [Punctularia strigosozonata HHB-11173 SS5]|uniref:phospholipase B n=1 Tax=Punctularia strigosozonata (strain HHB-11173) TaxID=741275 RepID=UPI00044180AD|nr:phospholipase B [Punctularia strigosozonata HHB-11173 SS5]EIN11650.1 phospholipase B [Punctularia strigosozonata HHB-11173 SS5]
MLGRLPFGLLALVVGALAAADSKEGSVADYAPQTNLACPDVSAQPLVRIFTPNTQELNAHEQAYVAAREAQAIPRAWTDWVGDGSAIGYDVSAFAGGGKNWSRVGIAISGGGYRAAQYGAGVLSGLDARNESAKAAGTGGLLQVASYLSALSGGSWLTGSLFLNNWPTVKDMVYGNGGNLTGWLLDLPLATPDGDDLFNDKNQAWFGSVLWSVEAKANKSIDTSITDPWGRMIAYHFLNQTTRGNFFTNDTAHGAGQLWSHIPQTPAWQALQPPYPLICADSRPVGSNSTAALTPEPVVYEITPHEFGSWDPNLSSMVNLTYAGTHFNNGQPDNSTACVTGFDEASFVMGTSASLFNQILDFGQNFLGSFDKDDGASLLYVLARQLRSVRTRADDVANWPNPFHNVANSTFEDSNSTWLELIDGSSNHENVPLGAMFVRARALDVVVAVDGSADQATINWPNGSSPIFSSQRMANILQASHQPFPPIPTTPEQFLSTGVNQRPTFFGCYPQKNPPEWPMVIYFPNSPPISGEDPVSNTGTFKLSYTPKHTRLFLDQVHNNTIGGFTNGSTAADPNFGKCLQCAAVDRARIRSGANVARSDFCTQCFFQYCYDPNNPPSVSQIAGRKYDFVDPDPQGVSRVKGFLGDNKGPLIGGLVGLFVFIAALIGFLIWWKKRSRRIEYQRVNNLHEEEDKAPWRLFKRGPSASSGRYPLAYELPEHK